ncbi:MAG: DMT family transporter [Pseudomonadota bacterium]
MDKNKNILPLLGLILTMFLWGSSFIALKLAFRYYHPLAVIFGRMALASVCFLFLLPKFKGLYRKGDWKKLLLLAFFEPCLYFVFEAWALVNTTASQAGMIVAILPLMVAVAARFFLLEPLTVRTMFGLILAIVGAIWLSTGGTASEFSPRPLFGNFLEFVAMACATGYVIMIKRLSPRYPPSFLTAVQAFVGAAFFFPLMMLVGDGFPTTLEPQGAAAVFYLGTFVTIGAYGLFNYGIARIPAGQASAFTNLIPVFAVILGWLVLGENFSPAQYVASVLVLMGVIISQERTIKLKGRPPAFLIRLFSRKQKP